jgi:hypothetical protein
MSIPRHRCRDHSAAPCILAAAAAALIVLMLLCPPGQFGSARAALATAHETTLSASADLFAGSQASLRCSVQSVKSIAATTPLAADIVVELHAGTRVLSLYKGKTGKDGVAEVRFAVPDLPAGAHRMEVRTKSALGQEKLEREVRIHAAPKVLLTTDKPLYQPGQTIHIRALALRSFDLAPWAAQGLTLEVEDGKGNKVFKKALKTSDHGIVHADFTLADEVNRGDYRIRALVGAQHTEKTVRVDRYVLPKFKVALTTDRSYYLPKELVKGDVQADYFFGKPVAGGTVEVKASTFDVAFKQFASWKGKTDSSGHANFEVRLPDYFVGLHLTKGNAVLRLEVTVTDTAEHAETVSRIVPVSDRPIRVSLIPEAGRLVPGVENTIHVAALYPDGSPAQCDVDIWLGQQARGNLGEQPVAWVAQKPQGKPLARLKTSASGLAEMKLTPKPEQFRAGGWGQQPVEMLGGTQQRWLPVNLFDLTAQARDSKGNQAQSTVALTSEPLGENVLLRLDRAICKGGDSLAIDIHTTAGLPTVYLDVVKSGQVLLTRWLEVKDGRARTKLDLPPALFGTLEVHAYQALASGEIVRD